MDEVRILGIYIDEETKDAAKIQALFTKYGNIIRTRLGLNEIVNEYAIPGGLIILELSGDLRECDKLEKELSSLLGVNLQKMSFTKKKTT